MLKSYLATDDRNLLLNYGNNLKVIAGSEYYIDDQYGDKFNVLTETASWKTKVSNLAILLTPVTNTTTLSNISGKVKFTCTITIANSGDTLMPAGYSCAITLKDVAGNVIETNTYTNSNAIPTATPYSFDIILNRPFEYDSLTLVHTFPAAGTTTYTIASLTIDDIANSGISNLQKSSKDNYITDITTNISIV